MGAKNGHVEWNGLNRVAWKMRPTLRFSASQCKRSQLAKCKDRVFDYTGFHLDRFWVFHKSFFYKRQWLWPAIWTSSCSFLIFFLCISSSFSFSFIIIPSMYNIIYPLWNNCQILASFLGFCFKCKSLLYVMLTVYNIALFVLCFTWNSYI